MKTSPTNVRASVDGDPKQKLEAIENRKTEIDKQDQCTPKGRPGHICAKPTVKAGMT